MRFTRKASSGDRPSAKAAGWCCPRVTCVNYAEPGAVRCTSPPETNADVMTEAASMSDQGQRKAGETAALRRFPSERRLIEALVLRDSDFADMCEELAEAEDALRAADRLPEAVRQERAGEWTDYIERLTAEIARALREANETRIGWAGHPRKRL